MNTLLHVARYHLVDRRQYIAVPPAIMAFVFLVSLVVFAVVPVPDGHAYTGAMTWVWGFLLVHGIFSVTRSLPFGLALGLSRRSYFLGTILLATGVSAVYALVLTLLQVVERATGGWGFYLHFFRIAWILDGPWYLSWLTSFVVMAFLYVYGMWFGLVYRRWDITGLLTFIGAQVTVLLAATLVTTWIRAWPEVGHFFMTLSAAGLTGVLAAVAAGLTLGGFTTMRRVTV